MEATALVPSLREEIVKKAKLAYLVNRYEEMLRLMNKIVAATDVLTVEERNLLSYAYNHVIDSLHVSRRLISLVLLKKSGRCWTGTLTDEEYGLLYVAMDRTNKFKIDVSTLTTYESEIESEISSFCHDILLLVDFKLIPSASDDESKVFYLKMKGDYWHHLADIKNGAEREEAAANTLSAYQLAQKIANAKLCPTNPIWLELALNFSAFYVEILNSPDRAFELSRQAYEEAYEELKTWERESSMKFRTDCGGTLWHLSRNISRWALN